MGQEVFSVHPIQLLRDEHRIIEQVLSALEAKIESLDGLPFPRDFFDRALEFLNTFSDGSHRYREERALFPLLECRGLALRGTPLGTSLGDHDYGRLFLAGVAENLDAAENGSTGALAAVRDYAGAYICLLRRHIAKEEDVIFPMAERSLTAADAAKLLRQFERAPIPQHCRAFADELAPAPCAD
jgi:hemerythrin-like domain-containing protein